MLVPGALWLSSLAAPANPGNSGGGGGSTGMLIFGIALVVVGAAQALKPDLSYKLSKWQYRNPEAQAPSNAAMVVLRIAGVIAFVVGVVLIIINLTK